MKIYKYELPAPGDTLVIKEKVIKFLDVQYQNDIAMVWAIVDPNVRNEETIIAVLGTGWDVPDNVNEYVGTVQDEFGYVWHYFTITVPELEKLKQKTKEIENVISQATFNQEILNALNRTGVSAQEATSALSKISNMWRDVL